MSALSCLFSIRQIFLNDKDSLYFVTDWRRERYISCQIAFLLIHTFFYKDVQNICICFRNYGSNERYSSSETLLFRKWESIQDHQTDTTK